MKAFNIFGRNLARLVPGREISATATNTWPDAIDRLRPVVGPGSGINVMQTPVGMAYSVTQMAGSLADVTMQGYTGPSGIAPASAYDTPMPGNVMTSYFNCPTGQWMISYQIVYMQAYNPSPNGSVTPNWFVTCIMVDPIWVVDIDPC